MKPSFMWRALLLMIFILQTGTVASGGAPVSLNNSSVSLKGKTECFRSCFEKGSDNWVTQPYWGGTLKQDPAGFLRLTASENAGRNFGRIIRMTYDDTGFLGGCFRLSGNFRGKGKLKLGTIIYQKDEQGKERYSYLWSPEYELSSSWRNVAFTFDFSRLAPDHLGLVIEVDANGYTDMDNVAFERLFDPAMKIVPAEPLVVLREGDRVPDLHFSLSDPTANTTVFSAFLTASPDGKAIANRNGAVVVPGKKVGNSGKVFIAGGGVTAFSSIDLFPAAEYDRIDALARQVKIDAPLRILIIGDSLLDREFSVNRGIAAMDTLNCFLNKYNPGKVAIANYSIRGDYVERVWERMNGNGNIFAYERYEGMFQQPADLIIVMLGHNDTRTTSESGFTIPETTPEKERKYYRLMLEKFKKTWPKAKIVLVSSVCGNHALTSRLRDAEIQKNSGETIYFYNSPALMKQFNGTLKEIADEAHVEFYNIFDSLNAMPQKEKDRIFNPNDGVHLTPVGQRVILLYFLRYFVK